MSAAQLDLFAEPTDSLDCATVAEAEPVSRRVALCQDIDQLLSIEEYAYDLGNEAFLEYCINRDAFRSAVNRAIMYLDKYDKPLAAHLKESIKCGNEPVYRTEEEIVWEVRPIVNE